MGRLFLRLSLFNTLQLHVILFWVSLCRYRPTRDSFSRHFCSHRPVRALCMYRHHPSIAHLLVGVKFKSSIVFLSTCSFSRSHTRSENSEAWKIKPIPIDVIKITILLRICYGIRLRSIIIITPALFETVAVWCRKPIFTFSSRSGTASLCRLLIRFDWKICDKNGFRARIGCDFRFFSLYFYSCKQQSEATYKKKSILRQFYVFFISFLSHSHTLGRFHSIGFCAEKTEENFPCRAGEVEGRRTKCSPQQQIKTIFVPIVCKASPCC